MEVSIAGRPRCRQEARHLSTDDLDWLGIASLRLNAELVRVMFGEYAHEEVISHLSSDFSFNKPIVIGSADEPGQSSDTDAVLGANTVGAKKIINLSNADHVYDSDPHTNPNAKKARKHFLGRLSSHHSKRVEPGG